MLFQSHPALGRISTPQFHFRDDLCSTLVSLCFSPLQRPAALDSKVYQLFFFFCLCPYKGSTRDLPGGPVAKKNLAIPTQGANVPWIADQETRSHMLQLKIPRATPQSQCHQLNKYLLKEKEKAQRNEFLQKWGCKSIFLFKTKFLNCCYNVCETTANNFRSKINIGCAFSKSRTKQASV